MCCTLHLMHFLQGRFPVRQALPNLIQANTQKRQLICSRKRYECSDFRFTSILLPCSFLIYSPKNNNPPSPLLFSSCQQFLLSTAFVEQKEMPASRSWARRKSSLGLGELSSFLFPVSTPTTHLVPQYLHRPQKLEYMVFNLWNSTA